MPSSQLPRGGSGAALWPGLPRAGSRFLQSVYSRARLLRSKHRDQGTQDPSAPEKTRGWPGPSHSLPAYLHLPDAEWCRVPCD